MSNETNLFQPLTRGDLTFANRVWMAPLTRNRSADDGTCNPLAATYYRQRASAGLILTEATQISPLGKGYKGTPGIYTEAQIESWKPIVKAVHDEGGRIFCQLWHVGRISHVDVLPEGEHPVSSSAVQAKAQVFTDNGMVTCSKPVALDIDGLRATVADFERAASCALEAGFDGVEVHSANGYLLDQFLEDGVNQRQDAYGGSIENRMRLLQDVLDVVCGVWPSTRVGVRLSPLGSASFDIHDSDPRALFSTVYRMLALRDLAYLHVVEAFPGEDVDGEKQQLIRDLRKLYPGTYIANGGYDAASASAALKTGEVDAVTFGRSFLANPDLPERFRKGAELNEPNPSTFYGGGTEGYTDYPTL